MLKSNFIVDLKQFVKVSLISRDNISQTYLIKERKTKKLFAAKIFNINSNEFLKKISNELLYELTLISDSIPSLFIKFRGISLTDFNQEKYPVLITKNSPNGTLSQIIKSENSDNSRSNWNDTKKLINIYGIAFSFLFLKKHQIINSNLRPENVYETCKLNPKINIFSLTKFESQKYKQEIDLSNNQEEKSTSKSDVFSFGKIIFSILTGKETNEEKNILQQLENNKFISKRYKKLVIDCISNEITFETILFQLKNDTNFITKKIDQKEFFEYVHSLETAEEEKGEMNEKSRLLNISYLNLNNYEKQELISRESSTSIFKIMNKDDNSFFTAKINSDNSIESNDHKINVLGEVIIHSHIKYPSIVKFVGYSSSDFKNRLRGVIVTEFMINGSLGNLLQIERDGNEIPFWTDTMKLINIFGIASAMSYLHSKNIVHRDLKPGNILLDEFLFPHLSNFGLSKILFSQKEMNSHFYETIKYLAPEIIIKDKNIKATDVYSFGMIAYQILTKKSPFIGPLHHQILINTSHNDVDIPSAYEKLIESCCDEAPKKRPTFSEIVTELRENQEFITEKINVKLFHAYIEFIDQQLQDNEIINPLKFHKYSLEPIYNDYKKILELKTYISDDHNRINLKGYKKLEIIGQGAFGKVFTIKDEREGKIFAAKKLSFISNSINDFKKRIQFSREVSILSVLNYPSIIKFIGYSPTNIKDKPKPVIALEYMKNGSLEDLFVLEKDGIKIPFWNDTMILINIFGIASAMSYLHSKNIIHRDLKPGNILLDEFLFPHLSDFGLSKFLNQQDNQQINSYILGTVQFIAPEIFDEEKYSKEADVYSFGMIVYQLMTKESPFSGLEEQQIIYKVLYQKVRPIFNSPISKKYKKLIEACWHQDPSKRPTFSKIVNELKTNQEFITENVDKKLFESYIEFIERNEQNKTITNPPEEFHKYSLDSLIKENEVKTAISSGEGFVKISNFEKESKILKNETSQIFEVKDSKTGFKYTATISNYIERFDNDELHKISQEAKKLVDLKHPTIQQFIGFSFVDFNHKNKPVILNESCNRRTLFDIFENERNYEHNPLWNDTNKLIVIYGIAFGMNLLHSQKISHPNLNPKNIFINDSFHPKLGEIGFYIQPQNSKKASSRSSSQIIFSQFYVAPEILESKQQTLKSDVYSFAFIVYEIMTNEIPFQNINKPGQIYYKIVNENYRPDLNEKIPEIYRHFIEECWLQNPNERPSFADIINELENNQAFITGDVNKEDFLNYIEFVKNPLQFE